MPWRCDGHRIGKGLISCLGNGERIIASAKSGKERLARRHTRGSKRKRHIGDGRRPRGACGLQKSFPAEIASAVVQRIRVLIRKCVISARGSVRPQEIPCRIVVVGGDLKSDAVRHCIDRLILRLPKYLMEIAGGTRVKCGRDQIGRRRVFIKDLSQMEFSGWIRVSPK